MSLSDALARHELFLPTDQVAALEEYCRLLWDWNAKINLTRHTDFDRFVARDVVDSLALARHLAQGEDVLDVGTGGGVPGIILAVVRPDLSVSLCESVAKKARVVEDIVRKLGLPLEVHHTRAEDLLERFSCDTLVARAVGTGMTTQPSAAEVTAEVDALIGRLTACGGSCAADRTEVVVKAACSAVVGSASTLLQ